MSSVYSEPSTTLEELVAGESDDPGECGPWPGRGMVFKNVALEVVVDGDRHFYAWLNAPHQVSEVSCSFEIIELIHEDDLPIASGIYEMDLGFWSEFTRAGWDDPEDDYECGFNVTNFRRLEL